MPQASHAADPAIEVVPVGHPDITLEKCVEQTQSRLQLIWPPCEVNVPGGQSFNHQQGVYSELQPKHTCPLS